MTERKAYERFKILFEDEDPVNHVCIKRFLWNFPRKYWETTKEITESSFRLDEEIFRFNVARLMPSFKMTRSGAFLRLKIDGKGEVTGPKEVLDVLDFCWKQVGNELLWLKEYISKNNHQVRCRALIGLSEQSKQVLLDMISKLFKKLITIPNFKVTPVAASKILFATIPEIALPVDNSQWKYVFQTGNYREIISVMVDEINEWEKKNGDMHLEELEPQRKATLPAVYNVMAMSVREKMRILAKTKK